jgi:hypothetical protein
MQGADDIVRRPPFTWGTTVRGGLLFLGINRKGGESGSRARPAGPVMVSQGVHLLPIFFWEVKTTGPVIGRQDQGQKGPGKSWLAKPEAEKIVNALLFASMAILSWLVVHLDPRESHGAGTHRTGIGFRL